MAIPNPISFWNLDESSGNATDAKGSNTLTNNNTVTYGAAVINNGAIFASASSQSLTIANSSNNPSLAVGGADFSIACWFNPTTWNNATTFFPFVSRYDLHERSYRVGITGESHGYVFSIGDSTGETTTDTIKTQTFSAGTWYHAVFSFVFSTTTVTIYHNGSSLGSGNTTYGGAVADTSEFDLGANTYFGNYGNGKLDMVGVWNVALSASDVTALYNGGAGIQYPFTAPVNSQFLQFF